MRTLGISVIVLALGAAAAAFMSDPTLDGYATKLQGGKSLHVVCTVVRSGGEPEKTTVDYSSPNRLRIETDAKLIVSDGEHLWTLDKTNNTYTETAASTKPGSDDAVWAWQGFFVEKPFKDAENIAAGDDRKVGGVDCQTFTMDLPKEKHATLFFDAASGLARGAQIKDGDKTTIILASAVALSADPAPDTKFAFVAPDGAKKVEPPVVAAGSWAAASKVLVQYCTGCHNSDSPRGGVDLSTYEAVMNGKRGEPIVVAGDAAHSDLIEYVNGDKSPRMPKGGDPLPDDAIKTLTDWINAGAKNP